MTVMFNATNTPASSRHFKRSRWGPILLRRVLAAVLVAAALAVTSIFPGRHERRHTIIWIVQAFSTSFSHSPVRSRRHFSLFSTTTDTDKDIADDHVKNERGMRIAIVGSGAVGSYYGARLWEAYRDSNTQVMFHMRNEHYDHCTKYGIDVKSYDGDMSIPPEELLAFQSTEDMADYVKEKSDSNEEGEGIDWVVCALKSTSLDAVPKLIEPLTSCDTRVLMIMNGLIEDDLVKMMREQHESKGLDGIGCKAIYGGMALICSNRLSPGKIDHSYGGKLAVGVAFSSDANSGDKWVEEDKKAILDLFDPATSKVPFVYESNLRRGRWWKNVWNLPFSGISVAMGGITVDRIVNDPSLRSLAYKVIDETLKVANADLMSRNSPPEDMLGEETAEEMMTLSDGMGPYKTSTMLDLHARKPMEVKYLFRKAVDQADALGVEVPHLETSVCQIEAYQRHYGLF